MIVHSTQPVTLIGGGALEPGDPTRTLALAPVPVAADGGAEALLAAGVMPEAVIGDMDSLSAEARAAIPPDRLHPVTEQETTDFDKCLRLIDAPAILGLGFLEGRLDHALAALAGLMRARDRPCLLIGQEDLAFHCPPDLRMTLPEGMRVSLYPLTPVVASATGLAWPLERLNLAPGGQLGTSNAALGGEVAISPAAPGLIVILPRQARDAALAAIRRRD